MTSERRNEYRYFVAIPTRWKDVDVYGHVNNVEYYSFFDTVLSGYRSRKAVSSRTSPGDRGLRGVGCRFLASVAFP